MILAISLTLSAYSFCQDAGFAGKVVDATTCEPLFGVEISVLNSDITVLSDFEGNFEIPLEKGTHTFLFSYIAYQDLQIENILLQSGDFHFVNVNLDDQFKSLDPPVSMTQISKYPVEPIQSKR